MPNARLERTRASLPDDYRYPKAPEYTWRPLAWRHGVGCEPAGTKIVVDMQNRRYRVVADAD